MMKNVLRARLLALLFVAALAPGAAAQTSTLLLENFDAVVAPDLPAGLVTNNASWKTSTSSASPGSGLNNLTHSGSAPGQITLGPIDFGGRTEATLSYWARRTSSYPADSLIVRFSVDGGLTFPHIFSSGGLPAAASAYEFVSIALAPPLFGETDVYLRFDGRGGSSGSANIRIDDVFITSPFNPGAIEASFGFSADSSSWNPDSGSHFLPMDLSWPGPDSIQGFQFDLDFDASLVALSGVSTSHLALSGANWEIHRQNGRIVVVSLSGDSIPPGDHSSILSTEWAFIGAPLAQDSTLAIEISGLVVAQASPSGDEISLPNGIRTHFLRIAANTTSITLDADSLGFGQVAVGDSTSLSLEISNSTGSADLVIDSVRTSSGVFKLDSAVAPIASGQSRVATFWFKPSLFEYGSLTGWAWIYHNAPSDSSLVEFSGIGVGGRGDADGDGALDIADVVSALDVVSGLVTVGPSLMARYDLYPFPSGDGNVDVRDLTVQIQAILRAEWPDHSPLPVAPIALPSAGKIASDQVFISREGSRLYLESQIAVRGIQLELQTSLEPVAVLASKSGTGSSARFERSLATYRSIIALEKGSSLQAGRHLLLDNLQADAFVRLAIVVSEDGGKLNPPIGDGMNTASEPAEKPQDSPFSVFPNPVSLSQTLEVTILTPVSARPGRIEVIDLLGRVVYALQIDISGTTKIARDQLPTVPGLMFLRMEVGSMVETRPVLLVR